MTTNPWTDAELESAKRRHPDRSLNELCSTIADLARSLPQSEILQECCGTVFER